MRVRAYRTVKSPKQEFVHVHLVIGDDHHIVEINDAMAENRHLSYSDIRDAIYGDTNFEKYTFQADDEGFREVDEMNSDIIPSGNVSNCHYPYSRFTFKIRKIGNSRVAVIKSTFNSKQVTTTIPIESETSKASFLEMMCTILRKLYGGFYRWCDLCMESMCDDMW